MAPVPDNGQLAALNAPGPLLAKVIVPAGVVGLALVSVTVAEHDVGWLTSTLLGVHERVVVVEGPAIVTVNVKVLLLPEWAASPL